jgi:O-antigen ligase
MAPGGRYQAWADVCIICLALYLLTGAQKNSATALTTLGVGITSLLGLHLFRNRKSAFPKSLFVGFIVFVILYGVAVPFLGGSNVAGFTSGLGRDATLTGRTDVWASLLPDFNERPILGYGFGSFWTDGRRAKHEISDGHNGYLDVMLELGAVGLAFYFSWLLSCALKFHKALRRDYNRASLAICFLIMILVFNVTESTLSALEDKITAVAVLISLVMPYEPLVARRSHSLGYSSELELAASKA